MREVTWDCVSSQLTTIILMPALVLNMRGCRHMPNVNSYCVAHSPAGLIVYAASVSIVLNWLCAVG